MSGVGEVAIIAGIISLAGQTIQTASFVYNLLKAYKRIYPRVLEIQKEIASLRNTLQGVADLNIQASNSTINQFSSLQARVFECHKVLQSLEGQLRSLEATSTGLFTRILRKAKLAADGEYFSMMYHQLQLCRADLSLQLELLQSANDVVLCKQIDSITLVVDKIEGQQSDTANKLLRARDEIRTDIFDVRSEQRLALSSLSNKVDQLITVASPGVTMIPGDLSVLDERLKLLESRLLGLIQPSKTESETIISHPADRKAKTQQILVRLVKPGILTYEEDGRVVSELIPITDRKAMQLDITTRLKLICHVQGLRMVLWLMQRNHYRTSVASDLGTSAQSGLAMQAKLTSSWEFCNSYAYFQGFVGNFELDMSSAVPWLRYFIDRLEDHELNNKQSGQSEMPPLSTTPMGLADRKKQWPLCRIGTYFMSYRLNAHQLLSRRFRPSVRFLAPVAINHCRHPGKSSTTSDVAQKLQLRFDAVERCHLHIWRYQQVI